MNGELSGCLCTPQPSERQLHAELRELLASNTQLAKKLAELESRLDEKLLGHDKAIASILAAIRHLMAPVEQPKRGIGFNEKGQTPVEVWPLLLANGV